MYGMSCLSQCSDIGFVYLGRNCLSRQCLSINRKLPKSFWWVNWWFSIVYCGKFWVATAFIVIQLAHTLRGNRWDESELPKIRRGKNSEATSWLTLLTVSSQSIVLTERSESRHSLESLDVINSSAFLRSNWSRITLLLYMCENFRWLHDLHKSKASLVLLDSLSIAKLSVNWLND